MTKLDELIKEYCPGVVEYKTLGEVCNYEQPNKYIVESTDYKDEYETPVLTAGQTFVLGYTNEANGIYQANDKNPVIIFDDFTGALKWVNFPFKVKSSAMKILTSKNKNVVILRYIFFCMENFNFYSTEHKRLWITNYSNFQIPVPPLAVQEEIVRILDKFTSLTAELTARRAQYEYYRDALLTPPFSYGYKGQTDSQVAEATTKITSLQNATKSHLFEANLSANRQDDTHKENVRYSELVSASPFQQGEVQMKKLGEIAEITRGGNFQKKDFVENGLPCIHYGQMYTHFGTWANKTLTFVSKEVFDKSKKAQPGDIVMAVTSENVEDVCKCTAWVGNEPIAVSGHTAIIHHNQNAKYLSYYFQSSLFYSQKVKLAHGTKVIEVTPDKLNDITIPLPPLPVQKRIVDVLDNFDAICSDLKIGLPAEIDARKKQYEYYRDLLLTFAERGNTILTEQNRTEQNRTEQNRTEQNRTEQNRTEQMR